MPRVGSRLVQRSAFRPMHDELAAVIKGVGAKVSFWIRSGSTAVQTGLYGR